MRTEIDRVKFVSDSNGYKSESACDVNTLYRNDPFIRLTRVAKNWLRNETIGIQMVYYLILPAKLSKKNLTNH